MGLAEALTSSNGQSGNLADREAHAIAGGHAAGLAGLMRCVCPRLPDRYQTLGKNVARVEAARPTRALTHLSVVVPASVWSWLSEHPTSEVRGARQRVLLDRRVRVV